MNKFIIPIFLSLMLNLLHASDSIFISPKVALKMIDKKNITFLSLDPSSLKIKGSKYIDINLLASSDILGRLKCSPFYICTDTVVKKYFSKLGIDSTEQLVLYDNSYGINSATLYVILESMGHKNISILRGGLDDIAELDLNWKIYSNYLEELKNEDLNKSVLKNTSSKLREKINILKPHLLIQERNNTNIENLNVTYEVKERMVDYFISKKELKEAVIKVRASMSLLRIVDACEMMDIVGNNSGSYVLGVDSLPWKRLINKNQRQLKSNEELEKLLISLEFKKSDNYYVYCMSGEEKAFFVMMVLRELGYDKVKTFQGDWNTWVGDINE